MSPEPAALGARIRKRFLRTEVAASLALGVVMILSGCAGPTVSSGRVGDVVEATGDRKEFEARARSLGALANWSLDGKMALRTEEQGWTVGVRWLQRGERFRIRLSGPLGRNSAELLGGVGGVVLTDADGKRFFASSADELVRRHTEWNLPVSGLLHWVRGMTNPAVAVSALELDAESRARQIKQDGWQVDYLEYHPHGSAAVSLGANADDRVADRLPRRLEFAAEGIDVTLVVSNWRFVGI